MVVADEDLGHRAAARALHHHVARGRIGVDADLFDLLHALGLEDLLGPDAIGADGGGVHLHGLHGKNPCQSGNRGHEKGASRTP